MLNIIPTLYEGYIRVVSVHRIVMENRPVDPQGQHPGESPTYILHKGKTEHARTIFCVKLSINNHIVGLLIVHKNRIIRTCMMTTQLAKLSFNHSNGRTHS